MRVQAVICSYDDEKFAYVSEMLQQTQSLNVERVVRIADSKSICEGYNRGAESCDAEWLLFCHDDVDVLSVNRETMEAAFSKMDVFGVCGTARLTASNWYDSDPNLLRGSVVAPVGRVAGVEQQIFGPAFPPIQAVQALDGIFIACRLGVWKSLRFDESLPGYTGYDIDFTYRAYLNRYKVGVVADLLLYHHSNVDSFSPEKIEQWENNQSILRKKFRFRGNSDGYVKHDSLNFSSLDAFLSR